MAVKKTIEIDVRTEESIKDVEKLTTSIQKTDRQTEATRKTTDSLTESLDNMTGGAISGFKSMVSGAKNGVMAMKSLKVAIAATGIGLLVVAVGSLVSYFTKTQRGADLVSKAFSGIGATVSVLIDRISSFGEGLYEILVNRNYKKGAEILKASMQGIGEEIKNESKAAWDLEDALHALEKREIALITVNAKREQQIKALRLEAQKSMDDQEKRGALLREAMKLQDEMYNEEVAIAKERARISAEQLALGESTREDERKTAELQAEVIRLEGERADRQRELQSELNGVKVIEEGITEELRKRAEIEALKLENPNNPDVIPVDALKESTKDGLNTLQQYYNQRQQMADNTAKAEILIEQIKRDQIVNMAQSLTGTIAGVLGTQSKMGKAAGIANALINTYQGIAAGVKLGFPAAIPAVAAAAATGFAAVKNIVSTKIPSFPGVGNAGGGGSSGGSAPRTTAPTPSFNIVGNNNANNQLGDAINGLTEMGKRPIKTYVTGKDVTEQQELDRNIRRTASVG